MSLIQNGFAFLLCYHRKGVTIMLGNHEASELCPLAGDEEEEVQIRRKSPEAHGGVPYEESNLYLPGILRRDITCSLGQDLCVQNNKKYYGFKFERRS
jgi:hypothetical protein